MLSYIFSGWPKVILYLSSIFMVANLTSPFYTILDGSLDTVTLILFPFCFL